MKEREIIKYMTSDIQAKMPDIEQVRANCLNQIANTAKKRPAYNPKRRIIITATIMILFVISFSVYSVYMGPADSRFTKFGNVADSLIFEGFEVYQTDSITPLEGPFVNDNTRSATMECSYDIKDREVRKYLQEVGAYYQSGKMEWVTFKTFGEALQHLDFIPSELNYLPENAVLEKVVLHGAAQDYYDKYNCHIYYMTYLDGKPAMNFNLSASYVGKNATIKVATTDDIEKVILNGGIEALLMTETRYNYTDIPMILHRIMWIKDNILYEVGGTFERDEIIKMAESVG
jgi:hypothetical protein